MNGSLYLVLPEFVIPAEAGIHKTPLVSKWMPAFAGMTILFVKCYFQIQAILYALNVASQNCILGVP